MDTPASASAIAVARPIPLPPPVMIATRPFNSFTVALLLSTRREQAIGSPTPDPFDYAFSGVDALMKARLSDGNGAGENRAPAIIQRKISKRACFPEEVRRIFGNIQIIAGDYHGQSGDRKGGGSG